MFDTHCHLNFKLFEKNLSRVIADAKGAGVSNFVVPGTDVGSSEKAVEIAEKFPGVYAAVGIHPHHVYEIYKKAGYSSKQLSQKQVSSLVPFLTEKKVVAIGEVGLDKYLYKKTVYQDYQVDQKFIELQKEILLEQLRLAKKYQKSVIIHNREAKKELLDILTANYHLLFTVPVVFHCCEADEDLLNFAKEHNIYIGVDGDVTYDKNKQEFVKKIPLELLVLETDSPFLRLTGTKFPNQPKNLPVIAEFMANLQKIPVNQLTGITIKNARRLFNLRS